jgi:putative phosphoesterase
MNVAVLSDIHDNIWNLEKVLGQLKKSRTETAIFCGDYCAPTTFKKATENFKDAYCVWGNVDGEKARITMEIYKNKIERVKLLGEFGKIILDEKKIAVNHYPDIAESVAHSNLYDVVFHGHTHIARNEMVGKTLLVNPGSVCGIVNGEPSKASYAIYDTKTNSAEIVEI